MTLTISIECRIMSSATFFIVVLIVIMLSVIMLGVIMLDVIILIVIMLSVIMLGLIILNVVKLNVVLLSAIMLKVTILNVIMLNVVILSVVALTKRPSTLENALAYFVRASSTKERKCFNFDNRMKKCVKFCKFLVSRFQTIRAVNI
jgi:hypothetical protein